MVQIYAMKLFIYINRADIQTVKQSKNMPPKTRNQQKKSRKRKLNSTADAVLSKSSISHGEEESQLKQERSSNENGALPLPVCAFCCLLCFQLKPIC